MSNSETDFPTTYMLDTNLLRYLTGKTSSQTEEQRLKKSAEEFWSKVLELETEDFDLSSSLEYELREFSSYAIQTYRDQIRPIQQTTTANGKKDYKLEYLQASDARILVAAYLNDAVLVTRNIKDFIVYLLFCAPEEKRLYDFVEKQFVTIPTEGLALVYQDEHFQAIQAKLEHLLMGSDM